MDGQPSTTHGTCPTVGLSMCCSTLIPQLTNRIRPTGKRSPTETCWLSSCGQTCRKVVPFILRIASRIVSKQRILQRQMHFNLLVQSFYLPSNSGTSNSVQNTQSGVARSLVQETVEFKTEPVEIAPKASAKLHLESSVDLNSVRNG